MAAATSLERFETPIIASFREYYGEDRTAKELAFVSLISYHDPTIRFTNSTTSVMKPLLEKPFDDEGIVYLAQPAIGTQGLNYWKSSRLFGPYASYFVSLGALYPVGTEGRAIRDALALPATWGDGTKNIDIEVHEDDNDLAGLAYDAHDRVVKKSEIDAFRHAYGIEGLVGRNMNLAASDAAGFRHILGNITKITLNTTPIAWEVSFDSPTVAAVMRDLRHAVEAHTTTSLDHLTNAKIAATDFEAVIAPLFLEGLEPKSRGRGGILRQFLTEYVALCQDRAPSDRSIATKILEVCKVELAMRDSLGRPAASNEFSYENALHIIDKWLS